ncbi:I78 family peptidase inhibitor [Schauerella aestuarii]|uniref:I78 family peptidase inhibitor n=1 Tax=Schauerella aestuarii TaxID=2511204 RepID=UPI00136E5E30|nr:I78 family peptidase inhibitor [Achromobacter aestuarii]MYZ45850.1 hypothetical protein [Achromobacter aestuarii]
MTWKLMTMAAVVGLAGCSMMNSGSSPSASASADTGRSPGLVSGGPGQAGECNSGPVQKAIGTAMSQSVLDQLRSQSGSGSARVLKPGEMITMEYNPSRLNVLVDAQGAITAVRCG